MANEYYSTGTITTGTLNNWESCCAIKTTMDANSTYIDNKSVYDVINELTSKVAEPEVPVETRTRLKVNNGKLYSRYFKDGYFTHEKFIMSDIKDVVVHQNVVIVTFTDNTKTKAVLDSEDNFSLEQGISICITKKLLGDEGNSIYNKLIERGLKVMRKNKKDEEKAEREKAEEKRKMDSAIARYRKRKLKKREEAIEIQKEAYVRAMRELNGNN